LRLHGLTERIKLTATGSRQARTAIFDTDLYNRSLRTGPSSRHARMRTPRANIFPKDFLPRCPGQNGAPAISFLIGGIIFVPGSQCCRPR
jgi:hypothetical protein